jgi:hypothetical protein
MGNYSELDDDHITTEINKIDLDEDESLIARQTYAR